MTFITLIILYSIVFYLSIHLSNIYITVTAFSALNDNICFALSDIIWPPAILTEATSILTLLFSFSCPKLCYFVIFKAWRQISHTFSFDPHSSTYFNISSIVKYSQCSPTVFCCSFLSHLGVSEVLLWNFKDSWK